MTRNQRFETRKSGAQGKARTLAFKTARATKYAAPVIGL